MGAKAGFGLKFLQWIIRGIQLLSAALILGIYSYFLAMLHIHNIGSSNTIRAVEGIAGIAVLYTLCALLLLCCVAGLTFTSFLAIILDVAFIGAFIYVAVANRDGAGSCRGYVDTPFGRGREENDIQSDSNFNSLPSYRTACRLQSAALAVSIVAIFFFIFSILMEVALARHHRKEKRFGPGPQNNYTSGSGAKGGFFGRLFRRRNTVKHQNEDNLPHHPTPSQADNRHSYATETTAINHDNQFGENYNKPENGYGYNNRYADQQTGPTPPLQPGSYRYGDGVYDRT